MTKQLTKPDLIKLAPYGFPTLQELVVIQKLPSKNLEEYKEFLRKLERTTLFRPTGNPSSNWKVFHGKSWAEALDKGAKEMATVVNKGLDHDEVLKILYGTIEKHKTRQKIAGIICPIIISNLDHLFEATQRGTSHVLERSPTLEELTLARHYFVLIGTVITLRDLEFKGKNQAIEYVENSVNVWLKGYGCIGTRNGINYVYCKSEPNLEKLNK